MGRSLVHAGGLHGLVLCPFRALHRIGVMDLQRMHSRWAGLQAHSRDLLLQSLSGALMYGVLARRGIDDCLVDV